MRLSSETIIEASAERVWEVVGHQFADIDAWATAVTASRPNAESVGAAEAPVGSRVCQTGSRIQPQVEETILTYDEAAQTLTYAAVGLPAFVTEARVRWNVSAVGHRRARAHVDARMQLRGLGRLLSIPLRLGLTREYKRTLDDLRHYVEDGQPSSRKQRRLARS